MKSLEFGVFLSPELLEYQELEKRAEKIEELGYHSLWISDHLQGIYNTPKDPRLESWTTLTAIATKTKKLKMGHLTLAAPFRNPALLAKMATTLDVISKGRAILSIGAGWNKEEFEAFGYNFGNLKSRSDRLMDAAAIIKKIMTEEVSSYDGKYYSIKTVYNQPKPVQKNGVPLMIAGGGESRTLKTCAVYGDMSNYAVWRGTPAEFKHKTLVLEAHCLEINRDPATICKTWPAFTFINTSDERANRIANQFFTKVQPTQRGGLIGCPANIVQTIYNYIGAGADMLILSFLGPNWEKEAELFTETVITEFR